MAGATQCKHEDRIMEMTGNYIKISIVTPNFNGESFLEKTIVSVLSQGYPNLEYIIIDGKSTDSSMRIVDKYAKYFAHIVSEPDNGHADAVNKGFALASGNAMGWINSDDMLLPGSLALVNQIFSQFSNVQWITGRATAMLESDVISVVRDARPWSWLRFLCGDYRHIQQESTFWRRELWDQVGAGLSLKYSLANDFELWTRFFQYAHLYTVDSLIGCFRFREGQRSIQFRQQYDQECETILARLLEVIPEALLVKYLDLFSKDRTLHPSSNFPAVPSQLGVEDPPVIKFEHQNRRFSQVQCALTLPSSCLPKETYEEDLDFDGSERICWTNGPNFVDNELVGIDIEFVSLHSSLSGVTEFTDNSPPMPMLIGPMSLYDLGSGKLHVQLKYSNEVISQNIQAGEPGKKVRLKVVLGSKRYAIIVNGRPMALGSVSGQQMAQGPYAKFGGGHLSRFWMGSISSVIATYRPRSSDVAGSSASTTSAINHRVGVRKFSRQRRNGEPAAPILSPKSTAHSDLDRFKSIHAGQRCFVMGNGPSLNKMNLQRLKGEMVFACNGAFLLFDRISWRPQYYTCVDTRVIRDRAKDIVQMLDAYPDIVGFFPSVIHLHDGSGMEFDCRSIISPGSNRYYFHEIQNSLQGPVELTFSLDVSRYVVQPYTVAITMLQIAAHMGFSEIYLIGCDTDYKVQDTVKQEGRAIEGVGLLLTSTADDDSSHFDPRYFGKGREWHNPQVSKMIEHHTWAEKALKRTQIRVFNATVGGQLEVYPRVDFESLF